MSLPGFGNSQGGRIVDENKEVTRTSEEDLKAEVERLRDSLRDIEDMHAFTFGKTSAHIGAVTAQNMQSEYEDECKTYRDRIAEVEKELKTRC